MLPSYSISSETRLVRVVYHDSPSIKELAEIIESILHDPDFCRGYRFLLDRSGVEEVPTTAHIERFVQLMLQKLPELGIRKAAAVVSGPACYGMARMAEQFIGLRDSAVFTDLSEAEHWLLHEEGAEVAHGCR